MKKIFTLLMLGASTVFAQQAEPLLTQYYNTPLQLNPANAGLFSGKARIVTNYRQQWANVSNPFTTISGSGDFQIARNIGRADFIGMGVDVMQDKAGVGELTNFGGKVSFAYTTAMDGKKEHFASIGFSAGFNQRSVTTSNLIWGAQWTDYGFDPSKSTIDQGMDEAVSFFDMGVGVNYYYSSTNEYTKGYLGAAMMHVNAPKVSFLNNDEMTIQRKININGGLKHMFGRNHSYAVMPSFTYAFQGNAYALIYGCDVEFILDKGSRSTGAYKYTSVAVGVYHRWSNSVAPVLKLNKAGFSLCASYDLEVGNVTRVSNGMGGIEVGLQYRVGHKDGRGRRNMNSAFL